MSEYMYINVPVVNNNELLNFSHIWWLCILQLRSCFELREVEILTDYINLQYTWHWSSTTDEAGMAYIYSVSFMHP